MSVTQPGRLANPGLLDAACLVVIVAGLKAAASVVLPVLVAGFLAILCAPLIRQLQARGVPAWLAILLLLTAVTVALLMLSAVLTGSVLQFQAAVPRYSERIEGLLGDVLAWLAAHGLDVPEQPEIAAIVPTRTVLQFAAELALSLVALLSNLAIVVLIAGFMLLEFGSFEGKLRLVLGERAEQGAELFEIGRQVQRYLLTKTGTSLATGVLVAVVLAWAGVDFPMLWGLIAFLFNYVPNVGSVLAAVPAILLSLVQHGPANAMAVTAGYVTINTLIGNILEPRIMGRRLGLSPLVVLLSLFFWGWVWGPLGMVLSVPLTDIARIVLEHSRDFAWVAVLLGPEVPLRRPAEADPPAPPPPEAPPPPC